MVNRFRLFITIKLIKMSRIIVKNLPKKITEIKIRELFSSKGDITDIQLKYTKNGVFRQFAFVGFKNEEQATEAMNYYNETFVNSSKIKIEICKNLGSTEIKPWSKHTKDKVNKTKKENKEADQLSVKEKDSQDPLLKELEADPEFVEFLEIHKKRSEKHLWSNDAGISITPTGNENSKLVKDKSIKSGGKKVEKDTGDGENKEEDGDKSKEKENRKRTRKKKAAKPKHLEKKGIEYTAKLKGLPANLTKKDIKEFFRPLKYVSLRMPRASQEVAYIQFNSEKELKRALIKNRGFINGNRITVRDFTTTTANSDRSQYTNSENGEGTVRNTEEDPADLTETGRIFVRNLPFSCTEKELETVFEKYGPVSEVHLPVDSFTEKIKGYAFVSFLFPEHAVKAFNELDGTIFQGRQFHLIPARQKKEDDENEETSFKKKKEKDLKSKSSSSHTWNTLFLGADTVANIMAEKYKTSKSKILGQENKESIAVRMALGETQIVQETKEFLEKAGLNLDAFDSSKIERSKTVILVKNLPANTQSGELYPIFSKHGKVNQIILPPSGVTAVVDFGSATEAKTAFRNIAYTRFHSVPLYLEWAPVNVMDTSEKQEKMKDEEAADQEKTEETSETKDEEEESEIIEEGATVFVKNLNFSTQEEDLKKLFETSGRVKTCTIARRKDKNRPDEILSMGYGFVQFSKAKSAKKVIKSLQGTTLHDHVLELKLSNRTTKATVEEETRRRKGAQGEQKLSTKILVRNIPFEASVKEVRELFSVFGELKFVRLPRKMDGSAAHRGFGFVDFVTKNDAKRAMESLSQSTHLYGRRLVLEWAETDDTEVDTLRRKTANTYQPGLSSTKKLKQSLQEHL